MGDRILPLPELRYNHDDDGLAFITAIEYDGEFVDVEVDSTSGKSYELDFYEPEEDGKELFAPMDGLLERIAKGLQDKIEAEGDEANTDGAEKDILGYISNLDLDELEKVDSRDKDGLYIDANDSSLYALVKDRKVLFAFEGLDD